MNFFQTAYRSFFSICIVLLLFSSLFLAFFFLPFPIAAQNISITKQNYVSANLGTAGNISLIIFGYSSPFAMVRLDGVGPYDVTYAKNDGYFEFRHQIGINELGREACLQAQDQLGRTSAPVCLPPLSDESVVNVGPIILPPTVSLNSNEYIIGDQIILSGQTLPNSAVTLSTFTADLPVLLSVGPLVKTVEAFSIPRLEIMSDNGGNFAIILPSTQSQKIKLFTQVANNEGISGRSNTLNISILPYWLILIKLLASILGLFKPYILNISILLQTFVIGFLIYKRFYTRKYAIVHLKQYSIVVYHDILPEIHP